MSVTLTVVINQCEECYHFSCFKYAVGRFCKHPDLPYFDPDNIPKDVKIPDWCPLKQGSSY